MIDEKWEALKHVTEAACQGCQFDEACGEPSGTVHTCHGELTAARELMLAVKDETVRILRTSVDFHDGVSGVGDLSARIRKLGKQKQPA